MRAGERIYEVRVLCPAISAEEAVNRVRDVIFDHGIATTIEPYGLKVITARYFGEPGEESS
jgi:hypothetical protein